MTKTYVAILLAGLLLVTAVSALAERQGGRPEAIGVLNSIDLPAQAITLDGKTYAMTEQTRWVGLAPGTSPSDVASKLVNHRLGFKTQDEGPNTSVVTEIWLMQ